MTAVPPKLSRRDQDRRLAMLVCGALAALVAVVVFFFDPSKNRFYPVCQFHRFTGLECPGCGATRAVYALLHGDFPAALHNNALLVALAFLSAVRGGWLAVAKIRRQNHAVFFPAHWFWPLMAAALVFGVLRNLPWFSFLSPD
jgi:hypothetical protein